MSNWFHILIGQCHTCPLQEKELFELSNPKCLILFDILRKKFNNPHHSLANNTSYFIRLVVEETSREKVLGIISLVKLEHPDLLPIKIYVRRVRRR